MLLTFPNLAPEDFAPWVNEGDDPAQQAQRWKDGLASWGQDGERIQRLREAAGFRIYTPGSNAGIPVSILKSFDAPNEAIRHDNELLAERINTTVTSLLGLIGIAADPLRSREHILISNILNQEWSNGRNLDIATLIHQIQSPSMTKVGVMQLDSFFPGEAERMFFVSLLLNQVLGWMRTQSGTTSEQRDQAVEKLRLRYAGKFAQLEERKRRAEQAVAREAEQAKDQKLQTAISFGATLLSSFMGRKREKMSTLGRATTAARGVSRSMRQSDDVDRAEENVAAATQKLADLEAEFRAEAATLERSFDPATEPLDTVSLKPTKVNINVKLLTLVWAPYRHDAQREAKAAWE